MLTLGATGTRRTWLAPRLYELSAILYESNLILASETVEYCPWARWKQR